ncbi:MAG: TetR/AcrR family transcriptional regulator [Halanaerobium sp.]
MSKNLKTAKNNLIKGAILTAAREIVEDSGFAELSIRKLAKKVGYSPGNIYQYFESKDQIIKELVQSGYQKIVTSLKTEIEFATAEAEIRYKFEKYIESALENKHYYKSVMLSQDEEVCRLTSTLKDNSNKNKSALNNLQKLIESGQKTGEFKEGESEIKAQLIWTATFGLIIRMIMENISDAEKQSSLIKNHFDLIFAGLKKGE